MQEVKLQPSQPIQKQDIKKEILNAQYLAIDAKTDENWSANIREIINLTCNELYEDLKGQGFDLLEKTFQDLIKDEDEIDGWKRP